MIVQFQMTYIPRSSNASFRSFSDKEGLSRSKNWSSSARKDRCCRMRRIRRTSIPEVDNLRMLQPWVSDSPPHVYIITYPHTASGDGDWRTASKLNCPAEFSNFRSWANNGLYMVEKASAFSVFFSCMRTRCDGSMHVEGRREGM